jgi:predicted alpha/beta-fold hydrolase
MTKNGTALEDEFIPRNVYSKAMGSNIIRLFSGLSSKGLFPDSFVGPSVDKLLAMPTPTLKTVDQHMTRFVGGPPPIFPLPSADAYYEWASSHRSLKDIQRPFLALSTRNDPIVKYNPIREVEEESQWVALGVTKSGGHLGWFEGGNVAGFRRKYPKRWFTQAVAEWCSANVEEVGHAETLMGRALKEVVMNGEFRVEKGRPDVGYKVLRDDGVVVGVEGEGGLFAGL